MKSVPFFRRSWFKTLLGLIFWISLYAWSIEAAEDQPALILQHLGVLLIWLLLLLTLMAQFVLPVRTWDERKKAIQRLLGYARGVRGPVTYLRNGVALEAGGERQRSGRGVLLIDHASGAVLRTKTHFTRAVGPGIVFSDPDEHLAEAIDLQRQLRSALGRSPQGGEAIATQAITQDGIPIAADLSVAFILDPGHSGSPREGRHAHLPPYEFNPEAAERAVYGHAYHKEIDIPWTELPLRMAADLWREQVKNWRLAALLDPARSDPTPLERIRTQILAQLMPLSKKEGTRVEAPSQRREFEILRARGIRMLDVNLTNLRLPADVHESHLQNWKNAWAGGVQKALSSAQQESLRSLRQGEFVAQQELAAELTSELRASLDAGERPSMRDTLALLLADSSRISLLGDPIHDTRALAPRLRQIADHLRTLDDNCRPPQPAGSP